MAKEFSHTKISYSVTGTGIPFLLLHGFGEDRHIWDEIIPDIKGNHTLIIPDLPGSGASELLQGDNVSLKDYAQALLHIPEIENAATFIVMGHSMGGYISLAIAGMVPEKIKALGLLHSTCFADDDEKIETRKKGIKFMQEHGAGKFLATSIPGLFADADKHKEDIDKLTSSAAGFNTEATIQYYHAMMNRPDTSHVLGEAEYPVLLIQGAHDKSVPLEQGLKISHKPDECHFTVLRHSGHMGMIEEKEKFISSINNFLHITT